jgi:hypothetical protein
MTNAAVEIVRGKVNQVAQSLKQDVNRQAYSLQGKDSFVIATLGLFLLQLDFVYKFRSSQ